MNFEQRYAAAPTVTMELKKRDELRYISMLPPPRPWIPKTRAGRLVLFLWRWCA